MPLMTVPIAASPASPPNPLFPGSLCCSWVLALFQSFASLPLPPGVGTYLPDCPSPGRALGFFPKYTGLSQIHTRQRVFPWTLCIKELPLCPPTLQHHPLPYLSSEHLLQPGPWCRLCHGFGGPVPTTLTFLWELELVSCFIPKGWASVKHIVGAQQCFLN